MTSVEYKEFDSEHAIPELAKVAKLVADNPCSSKQEIAPDAESEKHLAWLVSTGHVVAFTNGVYSAVEKFPKYGPQWRRRERGANAPSVQLSEKIEPQEAVAAATEEPVVVEEKKDESTAVVAE